MSPQTSLQALTFNDCLTLWGASHLRYGTETFSKAYVQSASSRLRERNMGFTAKWLSVWRVNGVGVFVGLLCSINNTIPTTLSARLVQLLQLLCVL